MSRTYSIVMGAALILFGVLYGDVAKGRMETLFPGLRNNSIFDIAAISSLLPYFILMVSIFLFCSSRRIALYFLMASIALPFLGMVLIAIAWKLFLPNLDLLLVRSFTVVFVGGSPFVGLLSLILLLPIFYQQMKKWGNRDLMIRAE